MSVYAENNDNGSICLVCAECHRCVCHVPGEFDAAHTMSSTTMQLMVRRHMAVAHYSVLRARRWRELAHALGFLPRQ